MKECKDSNNLMGEMFTDRLIKLRQARGWTKKEFSAKIGKTQQTVGKWENVLREGEVCSGTGKKIFSARREPVRYSFEYPAKWP